LTYPPVFVAQLPRYWLSLAVNYAERLVGMISRSIRMFRGGIGRGSGPDEQELIPTAWQLPQTVTFKAHENWNRRLRNGRFERGFRGFLTQIPKM